jgi:hypothetical protein
VRKYGFVAPCGFLAILAIVSKEHIASIFSREVRGIVFFRKVGTKLEVHGAQQKRKTTARVSAEL